MSDMIDRVAKAIDHSLVNRLEYPGEPSHSDILDAARAAIEAMREPTEEVKVAYWANIDCNESDPGRAWGKLIDAALKGPA